MNNKLMIAIVAMLVSFSSIAFGQGDLSVIAHDTFVTRYHNAPLACRAPECTSRSTPRRMPSSTAQYQEANRFLVTGARACLVDCTCTVRGVTSPRYCEATTPAPAATPTPTAPATTGTDSRAETPAPTPRATVPRTMPDPPAPPFMPQGMFGGQSFGQIGYCTTTMETLTAFQQIGIYDAIWYSNGARPQIMSMLAGQPGFGVMQSASMPIVIPVQMAPSRYVLVIAVNDREVVALRNGQPMIAVQQRQNGGYCIRGAIPSQTSTRFNMQVEGSSPTFDIQVTAYLPTPSGALGAPISTHRTTYNIADVLSGNRGIMIGSVDAGVMSDT